MSKPHWEVECRVVKYGTPAFDLRLGFSGVFTFKTPWVREFIDFRLQIFKREFRFGVRRWSGIGIG